MSGWGRGYSLSYSGRRPHQFWRLLLRTSAGNAFGFAEVQFRTAWGQPLAFAGGTASAAQTYNGAPGPYDASQAADGSTSTFYSSSDKNGLQFWQYDYGAGQALDVAEVAITARNDGYAGQAPATFDLQWSDDGLAWSTVRAFAAAPWAPGQTQIFTLHIAETTRITQAGMEAWLEGAAQGRVSQAGQEAWVVVPNRAQVTQAGQEVWLVIPPFYPVQVFFMA